MRKLTMDFETRSECDLKKCGAHVYAAHPSTEIMCLAFKVDDNPVGLWLPEYFADLADKALLPEKGLVFLSGLAFGGFEHIDIIEAHNVGFERAIWHEIMHKRFGFADLPVEKLRCSAAKVASFSLPRSLGMACAALGLEQQKDNTGYKIMMKMCKPRKATKTNSDKWHEDPADFKLLCEYCMQDVESEHELSSKLPDLSPHELKIWQLDQQINFTGVHVDTHSIHKIIKNVKATEAELLEEITLITDGKVDSPRKVAAMTTWLGEQGVELENLQKQTVIDALDEGMPDNARRVLEIRQALGKSSVAKLNTMLMMSNSDRRIRGMFMYYGGHTGRWSGKGVQPQNLPRNSFDQDELEQVLTYDKDTIDFLYGSNISVASQSIRGMIMASEGNKFLCADFSAIEARVLAWLAGEERILEAFRTNVPVYKLAASDIFNIDIKDVTKYQRLVGKVAVLALGYQGWVGAFQSMAPTYGVVVDKGRAAEIAGKWRNAHPSIVAMWAGVEAAAKATITTGRPHAYGRLRFGMRNDFLHIRLPSMRMLSFYQPKILPITSKIEMDNGLFRTVTKDTITFMGVNPKTKQWSREQTYGGRLTENVTQAVARDLLADSMLRVSEKDIQIVMHVHDELVCEVPDNSEFTLKKLIDEMVILPSWAEGCPIDAAGWENKRYGK